MKLPRDLSGEQIAKALCREWSYQLVHEVGSHIILQTEVPSHQRLAIPSHSILKVVPLNSILRSVSAHKGVAREDILRSLQ